MDIPERFVVRFEFARRSQRPDAKHEVEGSGWSVPLGSTERTPFSTRSVFDPANGAISITDAVTPGVTNWETDGSYEGHVSADGGTISATWTNRLPPHFKGHLRLRRCESQTS